MASRLEASPQHPERVELWVAAADLERAVDVVGDAMDEPPDVVEEAGEAMQSFSQGPEEPPSGSPPDPAAGEADPEEIPPGAEEPPHPDEAGRCPACGEAYRRGFDLCADCGVPLVPAGAPEDPRRRR
jgi:hypothetical protein